MVLMGGILKDWWQIFQSFYKVDLRISEGGSGEGGGEGRVLFSKILVFSNNCL